MLVVTIEGTVREGKSALAYALASWLHAAGFSAENVTIQDDDGEPLPAAEAHTRLLGKAHQKVQIHTRSARRD